jgi:hypothetical protein
MALAIGLGSRDWAGRLAESTWKSEKEQTRAMAEASMLGTHVLPSTTSRSKRGSSKIAA